MEPTLDNLRLIRESLKQMTAQSQELEEAIILSKSLVRRLFPEHAEDFELVAVEPSQTRSNFIWPGGTRREFEEFTRHAVAQQGERIDQMRLQVIQQLGELLGGT